MHEFLKADRLMAMARGQRQFSFCESISLSENRLAVNKLPSLGLIASLLEVTRE